MKVLFLAPYLPYPPRGGGEQRMYQMLRYVARQHDVHLLSFAMPDADLTPLREFCQVAIVPPPAHRAARRLRTLLFAATPDMALRGMDPRFRELLRATLEANHFDVVQCESIEMAHYGAEVMTMPAKDGGRPLRCYDAFNAEYQIQRRAALADLGRPRRWPQAGYSLIQWRKLLRYEQQLAQRCDLILAVSQDDRDELQRLAHLPVAVVPNGVDTTYFRRSNPAVVELPAYPTLLFTGTLDYRPNVDALVWFVEQVWPALHARRPDLHFRIAGQRPVSRILQLDQHDGIDVVGPVADMRPEFERATVYVLPMRVGGGVRLKLLETWAMGTPCVTTQLGIAGIDEFEPGVHALIADDPDAFRQQIERLLDDATLRDRLAHAGRQLVDQHYDWKPIVDMMQRAWERARGIRDQGSGIRGTRTRDQGSGIRDQGNEDEGSEQ